MGNGTRKSSLIGEYFKQLLLEDAFLDLADVFYGDQSKVPRTPAAAIELGPVESSLTGAPYRMDHRITVYILMYLARIQDTEVTKLESDRLVETVVDALHKDKTVGEQPDNLVIHGHVIRTEPGFLVRGGAQFRANRITWQGLSKTLE